MIGKCKCGGKPVRYVIPYYDERYKREMWKEAPGQEIFAIFTCNKCGKEYKQRKRQKQVKKVP